MGTSSFHGDAAHLELWVPGGFPPHCRSHGHQLCPVQDRVVEWVFAVQGFVKGNHDFWDVVESHGLGHVDRGHVPPVFLPVPSAVLEVVCAFALGCLAPFCVCKLKTFDGKNEVCQGFSCINALLTSRPETGPKHRCFVIIEHLAGEVVLPCVQSRMLDGVLRLGVAIYLSCMPLTSLCEVFLQGAKFLVTFILRAVAG